MCFDTTVDHLFRFDPSVSKNVQMEEVKQLNVIIVGGGLVGSLCACMLAERGYKVALYEKRPGRSINLALSHRGRKALQLIGIEKVVLTNAIPMTGRLLHAINGKTTSVPYDPVLKQCIYSVSRSYLNRVLLDVAEQNPNVTLHFEHKLTDVDFKETSKIVFTNLANDKTVVTTADFIVGADGAFSSLRSFLQKTSRFDFSQNFIDHGYLELSIPQERGSQLQANHLHIWPRGEFMMIALPNQDGSWTVTLFMPFDKFKSIDTAEKLINFFTTTFTDALFLIGEDDLKTIYFGNQPCPLVSIKCGRYDMGDKFLIIGDAAHAMVPFYGQGMNAGFEDCTLLNDLLNQTHDNVNETIKLFTERRQKDAFAICDLAMYNYKEMRDLVTKPAFKLRKIIDKYLGKVVPNTWVPLYNSVSFSHMKYEECVKNRDWQDKVLLATSLLLLILTLIVILFVISVLPI